MSHKSVSLGNGSYRVLKSYAAGLALDARDLQASQAAAMADRPMIPFAAAVLVRENLRSLELRNDFSLDGRALNLSTRTDVGAVSYEEHFGENSVSAFSLLKFLNVNNVTLGYAVLFTACFENRVRHKLIPPIERGREYVIAAPL